MRNFICCCWQYNTQFYMQIWYMMWYDIINTVTMKNKSNFVNKNTHTNGPTTIVRYLYQGIEINMSMIVTFPNNQDMDWPRYQPITEFIKIRWWIWSLAYYSVIKNEPNSVIWSKRWTGLYYVKWINYMETNITCY